jgi:acetyl esterase
MKHTLLCTLYGSLVTISVPLSTVNASTVETPEARVYIEKFGMQFPFDREQEAVALYDKIISATKHDDSQLTVERGLKYGPDERNRLDVHVVKPGDPARPIVMYVHGGGFFSGDTLIGSKIYDNVANYFARQGLVGINVAYRLAPKHKWPSGIDDVGAAVKWVQAHAVEFGGDASKIFLMGHSAGASHVAGFIFSNAGLDARQITGAILVSGVYSVHDNGPGDIYYGTDRSLRSKQSPMSLAPTTKAGIPTLLVFAEYDPALMQKEAVQLADVLCQRDNKCPALTQVLGHNHLTEVFHFDTADDSGAREILEFMRRQLLARP